MTEYKTPYEHGRDRMKTVMAVWSGRTTAYKACRKFDILPKDFERWCEIARRAGAVALTEDFEKHQ